MVMFSGDKHCDCSSNCRKLDLEITIFAFRLTAVMRLIVSFIRHRFDSDEHIVVLILAFFQFFLLVLDSKNINLKPIFSVEDWKYRNLSSNRLSAICLILTWQAKLQLIFIFESQKIIIWTFALSDLGFKIFPRFFSFGKLLFPQKYCYFIPQKQKRVCFGGWLNKEEVFFLLDSAKMTALLSRFLAEAPTTRLSGENNSSTKNNTTNLIFFLLFILIFLWTEYLVYDT